LTLAWLLAVIDPEVWKTDYQPVLSRGFSDVAAEREARANWGDPDEQGRGEFRLERGPEVEGRKINFSPATA
jgi:hypothetical protein